MQDPTAPISYTVDFGRGGKVVKEFPGNVLEEAVRAAFADEYRSRGFEPEQAAVLPRKPAAPVSQLTPEQIAAQGEIRQHTPGWAESFRNGIEDFGNALGMPTVGHRMAQEAAYVPFLGDAYTAAEAGDAFKSGRPLSGLGLTLLTAVGAVPGVGDAAAGGVRGALRGFHGSPQTNLTSILASPPARQYDNATSQFGAFFSPDAGGAQRYAGGSGRIYETEVPLQKPYEMPWSAFAYFQAPEKAADGSRIAGGGWAARNAELMQEAQQLKLRLQQQGYDGVVIRGPRGNIKEIASFGDVPLR